MTTVGSTTPKTKNSKSIPESVIFGAAWGTNLIIAEEDETPLRVGTPPIPIPNGGSHGRGGSGDSAVAGSVQVGFEEDFVAPQVSGEGLDRKMVPGDFEQVRVLGKGGYSLLLNGGMLMI